MGRIGPLGTPEIILIVVVIVLIFGARRLPALAKSIGQSIREFRSGMRDSDGGGEDAQGAAPSDREP